MICIIILLLDINRTSFSIYIQMKTYQEKNDVFMLIYYNYIKNNDLGLY